MRTCPVCDKECNTMVCDRCGFDGSRDYERWPTVAALKAPVESVAKRRAAFVSASEPEKKPKRRLRKRGKLILGVAAACLLIILAVLLYHPRDGWFEKFGKTYYYEDGRKTFGFTQVGNDMYYFDGNGVMQTGRELIHGEYYYFNSDGIMQTGWQQPYPDLDYKSDAWCYYDENGVQQHYWIIIDGKTYWLDYYDGRVTGLQTIDGKTYYFDDEGCMQTDCYMTIDGVEYYFDKNGVSTDNTVPDEEPVSDEEPALDTDATEEVTHPTTEETYAPDPTPPTTTPPSNTPPSTTPTEPEPTETDRSEDPNWFMCLTCVGKGRITCYCVDNGHPGLCSICYGTGVYQMVVDYETMETTEIECYGCDGLKICVDCNGQATNELCEECDGNGGYYWTP